jgi:thiol peroxidase
MAQERTGVVTFKGGPLTLVGPALKVGDTAPEFTALRGLEPAKLSDSRGKVRLISVVPSLDTPVCEQQTRRFNEEAAKLSGVQTITISCDLPFAQNRFCSVAGIQNLQCLSDYRDHDFGQKYGVLIKELKLLARSVFVIGKDDKIKHLEIVPEVTSHPDYDKALAAAKAA